MSDDGNYKNREESSWDHVIKSRGKGHQDDLGSSWGEGGATFILLDEI